MRNDLIRRSFPGNTLSLTLAMLFVLYALVALHAFSTTGPQVNFPDTSDTIAYVRMASLPIFQRTFLAGERAFIYALLLKMTGKDLAIAGYIQTVISLGCWGFLAWASLRLYVTTVGKALGFGMVLLCALREEVLLWNGLSLSESLSLSLFALWIGSWIMFARGGHRFWRFFPLVTSFLFAFVRDSNAFLVLGAAILLAVACACRLTAPRSLLLSLALVFFFLGSLACRSYSFRHEYSFANILGGRILVDKWRISELNKLGMPGGLSSFDNAYLAGQCGNELMERANVLIGLGHSEIHKLGVWAKATGQRDYLDFLVRNPDYLFIQPFREDGVLKFLFPLARWIEPRICSPPLRVEMPPDFHTVLPQPVRLILRGEPPALFLIFWAFTALACVVAFARHRPFRGPCLWTLALLLASIPHLLVVWHGDALDVPRHALLVGIQVHLAFAMAFALACDAFLVLRFER